MCIEKNLTLNIRICQFRVLTYVKELNQAQITKFYTRLFTSFFVFFQDIHDIMTFYCYIVKYFSQFISFFRFRHDNELKQEILFDQIALTFFNTLN